MRRPAAFVLGTILGSALLVGARLGAHPAGGETVVTGPPSGVVPDGDQPDSVAKRPLANPSVAGTPGSTPTTGQTGGGPAPSTVSSQPTTHPTSGGGSGRTSGTFAGVAVTHKYGTLRVTVTISGGEIAGIVESYRTSLQVSKRINAEALPQLRQEALTAQSADIDTVSGATYTSDAYRTSLQSALDNATN